MSDTIIKVENLGKSYLIGHEQERGYVAMRDVIAKKAANFVKGIKDTVSGKQLMGGQETEEFWALKDVNFEIGRGDAVGIIGRNGAGKSTLLKLLSRITEPTKGRIELNGRVASLLEVGTGFHPELSGRENIYLNGAILGMGRAEIKSKFDEIVDFSGVEKFLDTPVKRYSSGMYVRLAFAVAAHLEPEILVVDEVLAVGDAEFQKKCLGKMKDVAGQGRTVLFVSHNMQAISTLTNKCILLNKGMVSYQGDTSAAISKYLSEGQSDDLIYTSAPKTDIPTITRIEIKTSEPVNTQMNGSPMEIHFELETPVGMNKAAISFQILDALQVPVVQLWLYDSEMPFLRNPGKYKLICTIPKTRLYFGKYSLNVHFAQFGNPVKFATLLEVCPFEIVMYGRNRDYPWQNNACVYMEDAQWQVINE